MAFVKKFEAATSGATHKEVDGNLIDLINPTVALSDSTSNILRMGAVGLAAWVGRGYKENRTFSF